MFDGTVRPPKHKRMVCVCGGDGWFLRINTQTIWRPHVLIRAVDAPGCLEYDSYIELRGILDMDLAALSDDLECGDARILGRLGLAALQALIAAVQGAPTLPVNEKLAICDELTRASALRSE